ncbi:hypothetical protein ACNKHT_20190 [Shigella flexneri]
MGIDSSLQQAGGLSPQGMQIPRSPRPIAMLQRKASKPGQGSGKTTAGIHRTTLLSRGVKIIPRRSYQRFDDDGLHVVIGRRNAGISRDSVVTRAGQSQDRALAQPLIDSGKTVDLIGGCDVAMELDARLAIAQGHGWRWRFKWLFEAPDATHRHVALINKQGGRNAESRCQFFSVFQR